MIHELIDAAGALHLRARADGAWSAWSDPADAEAVAKGYLATPDGYKRKVTFGTSVFSGSSFTAEGTQAWCTLISAASWSEKYAIKGVLGVDSVIAYNGEPAANGVTVRGTTFAYDGSVRAWMEGKPTGSIRINWVAIGRTE